MISRFTRDMLKYKDWHHVIILFNHISVNHDRYITKWDSDKWCEQNCEEKWHRGFYRESDVRSYHAVYFKLEEDKVKFILWM